MNIKFLNKGRLLTDKDMNTIKGGKLSSNNIMVHSINDVSVEYKCQIGFLSTPTYVILWMTCGNFKDCSGINDKQICNRFIGPYECAKQWSELCNRF